MVNLSFMILSAGMVWGSVIGVLIMLPIIFFVICYLLWSEPNRPGGPIFFVKPAENMAVVVLKGNKFHKIILASKNTVINSKFDVLSVDEAIEDYLRAEHGARWEIFKKDLPEVVKKAILARLSQKSFWGMYWIGIPPIYKTKKIHLMWQEIKLQPKDPQKPEGEQTLTFITHDEIMPAFPIKTLNFGIFLEESEDHNNLPIDLPFNIIIKAKNLQKLLFSNIDAYDQLRNIALTAAVHFVKEETFHSMGEEEVEDKEKAAAKKNKSEKEKRERFSARLLELNEFNSDSIDKSGIVKTLGIQIVSVQMYSPELAGDLKTKLQDASTAVYVATEEGKAIAKKSEFELAAQLNKVKGEEAELKIKEAYFEKISQLPGAMKVEERKVTPGLTTLVEAGADSKIIIAAK
jgi:hypothetical protein